MFLLKSFKLAQLQPQFHDTPQITFEETFLATLASHIGKPLQHVHVYIEAETSFALGEGRKSICLPEFIGPKKIIVVKKLFFHY